MVQLARGPSDLIEDGRRRWLRRQRHGVQGGVQRPQGFLQARDRLPGRRAGGGSLELLDRRGQCGEAGGVGIGHRGRATGLEADEMGGDLVRFVERGASTSQPRTTLAGPSEQDATDYSGGG
jgi:hypothetical protein